MRILSCYIAGFGKFAEQQFDFTSPLTVIRGDNGWGKTTLADFLRCMLYGLDGGRVKSVENNDRVKYAPWRGGAFGGSLVFEYGGKAYRVQRSFGRTPAYDSAQVFDQNQMQCYEFGEKAERLGEILFGMNAESYKKSVFIPQGEIQTGSMPDDIKSRLLSLLSTGGKGETSAERALEKLDEADRALRARRRPAKGKLDEIDERLSAVRAQKTASQDALRQASELRAGISQAELEIADCQRRREIYQKQIEQSMRQNEFAEKRRAYEETQKELAPLREFFGEITPQTVNTEGIASAVADFYTKKARLAEGEKIVSETKSQYEAKKSLEAQADTCRRMISAAEGGKTRVVKGKKKRPKKGKFDALIIIAALIVAALGAVLVEVQLYLGLSVLGVGLIGMLIMFFRLLPRREKTVIRADKETLRGAEEARARLAELENELSAFAPDLDGRYEAYSAQIQGLKNEIDATEGGIRKFFGNFRFQEIYDYRAAVEQLKEKITAYDNAEKRAAECGRRLSELPPMENAEYIDAESARAQLSACDTRKEQLLSERADYLARAEQLERGADYAGLTAEEDGLTEEKQRLEKRREAILKAKEFLERAKEKSRYAVFATRRKRLSAIYGVIARRTEWENLRFAADGSLFCQEGGSFRALGYYSTGMQELIGLCTRFALVDATFIKETPVLILDDPLVNLDDKRTEKARKLIKELSKRYQIIYFTCKKERVL